MKRQEIEKNEIQLMEISQWLTNFKVDVEFDVYETKEFKRELNRTLDKYGADFLKLLEKIVMNQKTDDIIIEKVPHEAGTIIKAIMDNICILYEEIVIHGNIKYFFYNAFEKYKDQQEKVKNAINIILNDQRLSFTIKNGDYSIKEVSRSADRAYPSMIIDQEDRELWFGIQENLDDNANLSLLPDQIELLENIKFPIFINGQAGSGKSTMLFYLFAQICYKKIIEPNSNKTPQNKIVFITENQQLLKNSKKEIAMLLRKNPQYSLYINDLGSENAARNEELFEDQEILQDQIESLISPYFSSFVNFLKSKLEDNIEKFHFNKHINFYRFQEIYLNSRAINDNGQWEKVNFHLKNQTREKYSPEVAWYIIRTFIKGYNKAKELTENDFHTIARNDRGSLNEDTFKTVYKNIYEPFYKKIIGKGYWDNIDLIKELLKPKTNNNFAQYSVILCDEACPFGKRA